MKKKNENNEEKTTQVEEYYLEDFAEMYTSDAMFDLGEGITLSEESGLMHLSLCGSKSQYK